MDDLSVRAVIIGVNIFVTMTIVSLLILMFFQMGEIYGLVASTDTSIYNRFDDIYSIYEGKIESGIGLLNTIKKFEENPDNNIVIEYPDCVNVRIVIAGTKDEATNEPIRESVFLKKLMLGAKHPKISTVYKYEDRYSISVETDEKDILKIVFNKITK